MSKTAGTIVLDTREKGDVPGAVKRAARNRDPPVEVQPFGLGSGDFLAGEYLIERKTYPDFIGRMGDTENDIWSQIGALQASCKTQGLTPVLLVEGYRKGYSSIPDKAVSGAIAAIAKMGVQLIHTKDATETANVVAKLAEGRKPGASPSAIRSTPDVPPEKYGRYLVEGLPNVGPKTAQALLDHFGSPRAVFNAEKSELEDIDGIGAVTAERISNAVNGVGDYTP